MKPGATALITPRLQVLSEDQRETLFLGVLDILEGTGIRVDHDEGLELLSGAGARAGAERQARLPSYLVEEARAQAPHRVVTYNHQGRPAIGLEGGRVYFCSQVNAFNYYDPEDRVRYEQWGAAGERSLAGRANERVRQILREHQPEPLPPEVVAELDTMEGIWWQKVS
mgnify:CR=1 FL=1